MRTADKILSFAFFIFTALMLGYFGWTLYECITYVAEAIELGQLTVEGNEYIIINYYMSSCAQYFIYALITFSFGWIFFKNAFSGSPVAVKIPDEPKETESKDEEYSAILPEGSDSEADKADDDEELDKWFDDIKQSQPEEKE